MSSQTPRTLIKQYVNIEEFLKALYYNGVKQSSITAWPSHITSLLHISQLLIQSHSISSSSLYSSLKISYKNHLITDGKGVEKVTLTTQLHYNTFSSTRNCQLCSYYLSSKSADFAEPKKGDYMEFQDETKMICIICCNTCYDVILLFISQYHVNIGEISQIIFKMVIIFIIFKLHIKFIFHCFISFLEYNSGFKFIL